MTELETLLESPGITIAHDPDLRCIYVAWRGHHYPHDSVAHYQQVRRCVRQTRARRLLNDSSQCLDGWGEVARWVGESCFAALADDGVEAIAWVKSPDWPARGDIDRALRYAARPVVDAFEHTAEAYAWLQALQ